MKKVSPSSTEFQKKAPECREVGRVGTNKVASDTRSSESPARVSPLEQSVSQSSREKGGKSGAVRPPGVKERLTSCVAAWVGTLTRLVTGPSRDRAERRSSVEFQVEVEAMKTRLARRNVSALYIHPDSDFIKFWDSLCFCALIYTAFVREMGENRLNMRALLFLECASSSTHATCQKPPAHLDLRMRCARPAL